MTTRMLRVYSTGVQRGKWGDLGVDCPRQDATVSVSDCVLCAEGRGLTLEEGLVYQQCEVREVVDKRTPAEVPLDEIMTKRVITVQPDTPIETVVWLLIHHKFGGAPVVDASDGLVGIITATDLLRAQLLTDASPPPPAMDAAVAAVAAPEVRVRPLSGLVAEDVMTPVVRTLPAEATIAIAVAVMAGCGVQHLPIVSSEDPGLVVGVVSSTDLLRWMAGTVTCSETDGVELSAAK